MAGTYTCSIKSSGSFDTLVTYFPTSSLQERMREKVEDMRASDGEPLTRKPTGRCILFLKWFFTVEFK